MRKLAEMVHASKGYKLAIFIFIPGVLKVEICSTLSKLYRHENQALHTSILYMKMNHFNFIFHNT